MTEKLSVISNLENQYYCIKNVSEVQNSCFVTITSQHLEGMYKIRYVSALYVPTLHSKYATVQLNPQPLLLH